MQLARQEAANMSSGVITAFHVLVGSLYVPNSKAATVIGMLGLTPDQVRAAIPRIAIAMPPGKRDIELAGDGNQALDLAINHARMFSQEFIAPEHMLLGAITQIEGSLSPTLARIGINRDKALQAARELERTSVAVPAASVLQQPPPEAPQQPTGTASARPGTPLNPPPITYTPDAELVLKAAAEEAQRCNTNQVALPHLLMGILRHQGSVLGQALVLIGANIPALRAKAVSLSGTNTGMGARSSQSAPPPVTGAAPDTNTVLANAATEADRHGLRAVGPEHLMLALIRYDENGPRMFVGQGASQSLDGAIRQVMGIR